MSEHPEFEEWLAGPRYYGWDGQPITMDQWVDLHAGNRHVGDSHISTPHGRFHVSTVLLGLDHNWSGRGKPIIFETMIFAEGDWSELYCDRYATLKQARAGHRAALRTIWRLKSDRPQLIHKGRKP